MKRLVIVRAAQARRKHWTFPCAWNIVGTGSGGMRVLDDAGWGDAGALIAAMQWAVDNGIHVANLSLPSDRDPGDTVKAAPDNAGAAGAKPAKRRL